MKKFSLALIVVLSSFSLYAQNEGQIFNAKETVSQASLISGGQQNFPSPEPYRCHEWYKFWCWADPTWD